MIDGTAVLGGWEFSVGHWIEDDRHHVVILESHRAIRDVAFLEPEDEIVMVAPSTRMEFVWGDAAEAQSATMHARVWWRSRLDGSRD